MKSSIICVRRIDGTQECLNLSVGEHTVRHPIYFQIWYWSNFKGLTLPSRLIEILSSISEIALEDNFDQKKLFLHAFKTMELNAKNIHDVESRLSLPKELEFIYNEREDIILAAPSFLNSFEEKTISFLNNDFSDKERLITKCEQALLYSLGLICERTQRIDEAIEYYKKIDNMEIAIYKLALYSNKANEFRNIESFLNAAVLGVEEALYYLIVGLDCQNIYYSTLNELKRDRLSKAELGNLDGILLTELGLLTMILEHDSIGIAIEYFLQATKFNYAPSFYYLGLIYERGIGVVEPELTKAVHYYEIASDLDHLYSHQKLGFIYEYGGSYYEYTENKTLNKNIEVSYQRATQFYEKAAASGSPKALEKLAWFCWNGGAYMSRDKDRAKALAEHAIINTEWLDETSSENTQLDKLYSLLSDYYLYVARDYLEAFDYAIRSIKCGAPFYKFIRHFYKYYKFVSINSQEKDRVKNYENIVLLCECALLTIEKGLASYYLGKIYKKGLLGNSDSQKANEYFSISFNEYEKHIQKQNTDKDLIEAYVVLGRIGEMGVVENIEKTPFYYQKALQCVIKSVKDDVYAQKANRRFENHSQQTTQEKSNVNNYPNYKIIDSLIDKSDSHIMISYARESRTLALTLKRLLEKYGFKIWIDVKDLRKKIYSDMALGIEKSSHVITCLSEGYERSEYCSKELHYAIKCKKRVIPIIVQEKYVPKDWLGIITVELKYYRATTEQQIKNIFPEVLEVIGESSKLKYEKKQKDKNCTVL